MTSNAGGHWPVPDISESVFHRWQNGDKAARDEVWEELWNHGMRRFIGQVSPYRGLIRPYTPEDVASDVFPLAFAKLDATVRHGTGRRGPFQWEGAAALDRFFRTILTRELYDRLKDIGKERGAPDPIPISLDSSQSSGEEAEGRSLEEALPDPKAPDPQDESWLEAVVQDHDNLLALRIEFRQILSNQLQKAFDAWMACVDERTDYPGRKEINTCIASRLGAETSLVSVWKSRILGQFKRFMGIEP